MIQKKLCKIDALKFCNERFKQNTTHLKFYTGFESFDTFKAVLDYLNPAANSLAYWGSNTNIAKIVSPDFRNRGSKRIMIVEEELSLTLVGLRCALPTEDLTAPFNLSSSSISRILITWIDFLHSQLGMLPIWASKETVVKTMPYCFKSKYPTIRIILECTVYRDAL